MQSVADTLAEANVRKALGISAPMIVIRSPEVAHLSLECGDTYLYCCLGKDDS